MPVTASSRALASLGSWISGRGVKIDDRQWEQLELYLDNLVLWNRRLALVSQKDPASILAKHFADSIVAAEHCHRASTIVDLGSGAGFPGMVIAVCCPAARVTLIESRGRKASFLLDSIRVMGLANVEVVTDRIESASREPKHAARYQISIARALGGVVQLLEYSQPFLCDAGQAIAMKGPSYAGEIETAPIQRLGFGTPQIYSYSLPDHSQRVLLSFARLRAEDGCST